MIRCLVAALVLLAATARADVRIRAETEDEVHPANTLVRLEADGDFDSAVWFAYPDDKVDGESVDVHVIRDTAVGRSEAWIVGKRYLFAAPPGRYQINVVTSKGGTLAQARFKVTIGEPPAPIPPVPPIPVPTPPQPEPAPPGPLKAMRVALVFESQANLTRGQMAALYSPKVRDYLDRACGKDESGRPAWRAWDRNTKVERVAPSWAALWAQAGPFRADVKPTVVVTGEGLTAPISYPLPESDAELLAILKRHGGE